MSEILVEQIGLTLHLTINRPDKKNALTPAMYASMTAALTDAAGDFGIRTVVISGSGSDFTAGNDIANFLNTPPTGSESPVFQFIYAVHDFPKPIIAAVHGYAVGIGTTLLLHCDLVFAAPDSIFSMPFVSLGLVPEFGSSLLFPKLVGHVKAAEIFLTGRDFGAQESLDMGLINAIVVEPGGRALAVAEQIGQQPPNAVITTKALIKSGHHSAVSTVINAEGELFRLALDSDEAKDAFMKFLAKRSR